MAIDIDISGVPVEKRDNPNEHVGDTQDSDNSHFHPRFYLRLGGLLAHALLTFPCTTSEAPNDEINEISGALSFLSIRSNHAAG